MRRPLVALILSGTLVLAACGERPSRMLSPRPQADLMVAGPTCSTSDAINSEITALFSGGNQTAALSRFNNIMDLVGVTSPGPDTATAQEHALDLVGFTLEKFRQGTLTGGLSDGTRDQVLALANGFLCFTGLPRSLSLGAMGPDGAVAIITTTSPSTTIKTGTDWAGMQIDSGTVTQTVLVTISRLPDTDRLLTQLDQYPLYYEFQVTPAGALGEPVVVGVCPAASWTPPDPGRLRLAHNVAPYTAGSIEILPFHEVPFLDCSDAALAAVPSGIPLFDFAQAGWRAVRPVVASLLLPQRLMAFATGGVGGTTKTFSPFGVVDTLVYMDAVSPLSQRWPVGGTVPQPPSVRLRTPMGNALVGMAVDFAVTAGGGSLTGASASTDSNGVATLGSWVLGLSAGLNTVGATATPLHAGSGVSGSPMTFSATALPPSQLKFLTQPSDVVAGNAIAPPVQVAVRDEDGHLVNSSAASVAMAIGTGPAGAVLGGTKTVSAVNGVATFSDLSLIKAFAGYTLVASSAPLSSATSAAFNVSHASAATIQAVAGDGQTAPEGTAVSTRPSVRVLDAYSNPVPGVSVTFTVQNGGGSVTGATTTTDASGVATVGSWALVSGVNYLLATAGAPNLAGNPVTFTATGTSSTSMLLACPASNGAGDDLSRAFYLSNYPGRSLKQVDLYLSSNASANTPTPYTIQLIAKSGGFNGSVIGTSTVTVYLRGNASQNLLTHFVYTGTPAVSRNSTVAFQFNVLGNPDGSTLRFNVGSCGVGDTKCRTGCGIVETNDATGILSTFRRKGCGINIIGGS